MPNRVMTYCDYKAEMLDSDISLTFLVPYSKFGSVTVILAAPDATELLRQIEKALDASDVLLASEAPS